MLFRSPNRCSISLSRTIAHQALMLSAAVTKHLDRATARNWFDWTQREVRVKNTDKRIHSVSPMILPLALCAVPRESIARSVNAARQRAGCSHLRTGQQTLSRNRNFCCLASLPTAPSDRHASCRCGVYLSWPGTATRTMRKVRTKKKSDHRKTSIYLTVLCIR